MQSGGAGGRRRLRPHLGPVLAGDGARHRPPGVVRLAERRRVTLRAERRAAYAVEYPEATRACATDSSTGSDEGIA